MAIRYIAFINEAFVVGVSHSCRFIDAWRASLFSWWKGVAQRRQNAPALHIQNWEAPFVIFPRL